MPRSRVMSRSTVEYLEVDVWADQELTDDQTRAVSFDGTAWHAAEWAGADSIVSDSPDLPLTVRTLIASGITVHHRLARLLVSGLAPLPDGATPLPGLGDSTINLRVLANPETPVMTAGTLTVV